MFAPRRDAGLGDQLYQIHFGGLGTTGGAPGPLAPRVDPTWAAEHTAAEPTPTDVEAAQRRQWVAQYVAPLVLALVPAAVGYGVTRWRVGSHWSSLSLPQHLGAGAGALAAGAVGGIGIAALGAFLWETFRTPGPTNDQGWSLLIWWILASLCGGGLTAGAAYATLTR